MKLHLAQNIANEITHALQPHCAEIQVAGSIRRQVPEVKDVEIVYISQTTSQQMDLFGDHFQTHFHADDAIISLINDGTLTKDTTIPKWGTKYKRAVHRASGVVIEFFRAQSNNWGYILALRTGPADFNRLLVTKQAQGGALPTDIKLQGGYVWGEVGKIPMLTEYHFFTILNLPFVPPTMRSTKWLRHYIQKRQNR